MQRVDVIGAILGAFAQGFYYLPASILIAGAG